jgi:hypothetical protein
MKAKIGTVSVFYLDIRFMNLQLGGFGVQTNWEIFQSRKEIKSDTRLVHRSLLQTRCNLKTVTVKRSIEDRAMQTKQKEASR